MASSSDYQAGYEAGFAGKSPRPSVDRGTGYIEYRAGWIDGSHDRVFPDPASGVRSVLVGLECERPQNYEQAMNTIRFSASFLRKVLARLEGKSIAC